MARRRRRSRGRSSGRSSWFGGYATPPEPVPTPSALRRRLGREPAPVSAQGRKLASTFWGLAWCDNLERYHDFENRLPRGRTYLRQGAVLDLCIEAGCVSAVVRGTSLYDVRIEIDAVSGKHWAGLRAGCAGRLSSVLALLQGRIDPEVMAAVTEPHTGLFPEPRQIHMRCSCPDWATMCKHVAAVLYGVGVRLDRAPELLFTLRGVEAEALVGVRASLRAVVAERDATPVLAATDLGAIFGVTISDEPAAVSPKAKRSSSRGRKASRNGGASATDADAEAALPPDVASWTVAELATRGGCTIERVVEHARDVVAGRADSKAARQRRARSVEPPGPRDPLERLVAGLPLRELVRLCDSSREQGAKRSRGRVAPTSSAEFDAEQAVERLVTAVLGRATKPGSSRQRAATNSTAAVSGVAESGTPAPGAGGSAIAGRRGRREAGRP